MKRREPRRPRRWEAVLIAIFVLVPPAVAPAQEGHDHMAIWSTEPEGGELTTTWDFAHKKVQLFRSFCVSGECFYSTVNPALLAFDADDDPDDDLYPLQGGTPLSIELIAAAAAVTLNVNGNRLNEAGESARLGTTPNLHVHPNWQLLVPENEHGDYEISFKLTSAPPYAESQVFTSVLTNVAPPTTAPTPTPTPQPEDGCAGDCDHDGQVTIEELVLGMKMAVSGGAAAACPACDGDHDGTVTVGEMVRAVSVALHGCVRSPTPTRPPASLRRIQDEIFTPKCAIPTCHVGPSGVNDLVLSDGASYGELVNVEPYIDAARLAGLLRVVPGDPARSFLLIKLEGPPLDQGSRMPLSAAPLSQAEIDLVRDWIVQGAAAEDR